MNLQTFTDWLIFDLRQAGWDLLVNWVGGSICMPRVGRYLVYRAAGIKTASPSLLPGIFFQSGNVRIGRYTFINRDVKFYCKNAAVELGNHVEVAMGVSFITDTHAIGGGPIRCGSEVISKPISVGDGCWIGANATVLPGVTLGRGCVIAAGAVVAGDCMSDGLYGGVPARRIRDLSVQSPLDLIADSTAK